MRSCKGCLTGLQRDTTVRLSRFLYMPRQQCAAHVRRSGVARNAKRSYERRLIAAMTIYVIIMMMIWPLARSESNAWLKAVYALAPVPPMLYAIWLMAQRIIRSDELEQRTHMIGLGVSAAVVSVISLVSGFLAAANVLTLDATEHDPAVDLPLAHVHVRRRAHVCRAALRQQRLRRRRSDADVHPLSRAGRPFSAPAALTSISTRTTSARAVSRSAWRRRSLPARSISPCAAGASAAPSNEQPSARTARPARLVAGRTCRSARRVASNRQCDRNRQIRSEPAAGVPHRETVSTFDRIHF